MTPVSKAFRNRNEFGWHVPERSEGRGTRPNHALRCAQGRATPGRKRQLLICRFLLAGIFRLESFFVLVGPLESGGGPDLVDLSALIDKARRVKKAGENIFWQHQDRFSYRQEKNISMGGVSGWIEFAGEAAEFIPFLKLAEHLHIGKGTGLGLGKIGVDVLR